MTTTSTIYPIIGALLASERELGPNRRWSPVSGGMRGATEQSAFLEIYRRSYQDIARIPELCSVASRDHLVINKFLTNQGFSIQLQPFRSVSDFGTASVLDLCLKWLVPGTQRTITDDNEVDYKGVHLKSGVTVYNNGVVAISTGNGDIVYLKMGEPPADIGDARLDIDRARPDPAYAGVVFPKVDIDVQPDISWLLGMSTVDQRGHLAYLNQALQQTKFSMDENGATVRSAVAMGISKGRKAVSTPQPFRINRPFLVVIRRPGLTLPLFTGYMASDPC